MISRRIIDGGQVRPRSTTMRWTDRSFEVMTAMGLERSATIAAAIGGVGPHIIDTIIE
jgi:hypothetical protein